MAPQPPQDHSTASSIIDPPVARVESGTTMSSVTTGAQQQKPLPNTGLSLGDRTRTQSISFPPRFGGDSRKGSVVDADCPLCQNDRIHSVTDVKDAFKLTWIKNRKHLLITWLHVPVGVTLMLVVVWAIKLGMDRTALRFPAAVLSMIVFLVLLLILDGLSIRFPGRKPPQDPEVPGASRGVRKRFLDPFMAALAPPADFLLRNMSVMFTPAFIMIPAREVIPGREIGILAAYFFLTQLLGYVFPVLMCMFVDWLFGIAPRRKRQKEAEKQFEHLRRNSVVGTGSGFGHPFEKGLADAGRVKNAPIVAGLFASSVVAFAPLRPVQPRLDQLPEDEWTHMSHVAIEQARQQGMGPAIAPPARGSNLLNTPKSDVSTFQHPARRHANMKRAYSEGFRLPSARRTAAGSAVPGVRPRIVSGAEAAAAATASSAAQPQVVPAPAYTSHEVEELATAPEPMSPGAAPSSTTRSPASVPFQMPFVAEAYEFPPRSPPPMATLTKTVSHDLGRRPSILEDGPYTFPPAAAAALPEMTPSQSKMPTPPQPARIAFDPVLETAASVRAAKGTQSAEGDEDAITQETAAAGAQAQQQSSAQGSRRGSLFSPSAPGTRRNSLTIIASRGSSRLNSKVNDQFEFDGAAGGGSNGGDDNNNEKSTPAPSVRCRHNSIADSTISCGPNAVERLSDWLGDLISPTIYTLLFLVGLPLYFVLDFSLPLFLGINLLVFIFSITIVPPKVRRFAHPILTTSVGTVFIIWAFAAMKGRGLKETLLQSYQVDAKYSDIWVLGGYSGPVPGAGDFLISTLDAGIVALAVPCYRYRAELKESFWRLIVVLVPCAALSLFVWPGIAHLITLDRSRSLAFAARFMSTPLAIELNNTLGGDENIVVILVVITGIVAAILKEPFFKLMRVSMDDHFIVGATFGATSGAIGASSLIARPKVMAVASLSFVIFGAILLICAAVPPLVEIVRTVAGF
ncbi:hypothetical protein V8E36_008652 [Tilletia maclaganii]